MAGQTNAADSVSKRGKWHTIIAVSLIAVMVGLLAKPLYAFFNFARASEIHSYVLLIPLAVIYLLHLRKKELPAPASSIWPAVACFAGALGLLFLGQQTSSYLDDTGDQFTFVGLSFTLFVWAFAYFDRGARWVWRALFPMCFLFFVTPLPSAVVDTLEEWSKLASAEVANAFFVVTGMPTLRQGTVFQLPGITLEVAKECSGIHSSLVLLVTSVLAANMFLRSGWRRCVFVLAAIPLGLLRNGFRILVISMLCVYIGPHMINHPIHRKGGPIFFALSLLPLLGLLWWLARSERSRTVLPPKGINALPGDECRNV